jgi:hypothetical protein
MRGKFFFLLLPLGMNHTVHTLVNTKGGFLRKDVSLGPGWEFLLAPCSASLGINNQFHTSMNTHNFGRIRKKLNFFSKLPIKIRV